MLADGDTEEVVRERGAKKKWRGKGSEGSRHCGCYLSEQVGGDAWEVGSGGVVEQVQDTTDVSHLSEE